MKTKTMAKNTREFDRRFDSGEDIHDLIDMSKTTVIPTGKRVASPSMSRNLVKQEKGLAKAS